MKFEPKHVVTMVVALCAAVVLAPVGVMAATGQLVNIVDPSDSARRAKVSSVGALYVENRAGVPGGAFNLTTFKVTDVVLHKLLEVPSPKRIAITEVMFTVRGTDNGPNSHVSIYSFTSKGTFTYDCGHPSGWTKKVLRSVSISPGTTQQLLFNGPALLLPAAPAGQKTCLGVHQTTWPGGTDLDVAISGYTF